MSSERSNGGIGFVGILQILFIGLKLTKLITWSWLYVMIPSIASVCIALLSILIVVLMSKK